MISAYSGYCMPTGYNMFAGVFQMRIHTYKKGVIFGTSWVEFLLIFE